MWSLTGLTCNGNDLGRFLGTALSLSVTVSGSSYVLRRSAGGCTLTDRGTLTFNEAAGTVSIAPSQPTACEPAGCDSDCGGTGAPSQPIQVTVSGATMVVTAADSGTFPNNVCQSVPGASPPGRATFTRQ
jgi:hypothetical protein